jgi:uncharacterized membrane protein YgcG
MRRLLVIGAILGTVLGLQLPAASASTLADCLAQQHVCVSGSGRTLISPGQESQLEREIGQDQIYLVAAPSGSAGYNAAMRQIISMLGGHQQFTVGYLDSQQRHFGAYSKGMLPPHGAADIATQVVDQHQGNVFTGLTAFVQDVQQQAGSGATSGTGGAAASGSSHVLRNVLIILGIIVLLAVLGGVLIWRPIRRRRQQELKEAKTAAQDDLIALSAGVTDHEADLTIQSNPEAAAEQAAALTAYEQGTAALDAARSVKDMGAVSRAIAEGQYHLAAARALAAGQPRPARRAACFFDPRHGMSVRDVLWAPPDGGPAREVPACYDDARKVDQGIEPELRRVEVQGQRVPYVNAGFAPAYWGGYGFLPGMFTGFLLGEALAPGPFFPGDYYGDPGAYSDDGTADQGNADYGNGDYGGGDFSDSGDYGGGDFGGGGDWGGGDFGGGGDFS